MRAVKPGPAPSTAFTAYSADMNRAAAPVTSIEEMSLNRRWAAPKLPRLSFNHLAVSGCTIAVPPISLGGGGRVEVELSLSEGLRRCVWVCLWRWLWLLEA